MDLKQLCEIHAPSGDEYKLRALLLEESKKLCGEENVKVDRMGNVLCFKKGTEVEQPPRSAEDANIRQNTIISRKYYLAALTDETKAVKITVGA